MIHKAIYETRDDIRSITHSHPPSLISFALAHNVPDTRIFATAYLECGDPGYAEYAIPGSPSLAENISKVFGEGADTVIMENHGVITAGETCLQAFQRFETLDYVARILNNVSRIGNPVVLNNEEIALKTDYSFKLEEFMPEKRSNEELELRTQMCRLIKRAYNQKLFTSTEGTFSTRVGDGSFLISPYGKDRVNLEPEDLVLIRDGYQETGKKPSRSLEYHIDIYKKHPEIAAVIIAHPPNVMAYGVSGLEMKTHSLPETFILLQDIGIVPYGAQHRDPGAFSEALSSETPSLLVQNDCYLVTGSNLLETYDRLEIAEFSASALIKTETMGGVVEFSEDNIEELKKKFLK
jgi:L-fuculose-phosphate aldolase